MAARPDISRETHVLAVDLRLATRGRAGVRPAVGTSRRVMIFVYSAQLSAARPSVPIVQRPRTWPFQGQNTGSNPVGDAIPDSAVEDSFNCMNAKQVTAVQLRHP